MYLIFRQSLLLFVVALFNINNLKSGDSVIAYVTVQEGSSLPRERDYITCSIQVLKEKFDRSSQTIIAEDMESGSQVICQIYEIIEENSHPDIYIKLIFPMSIGASEYKSYVLKIANSTKPVQSDLKLSGEGFDLRIENTFYRADLSKNELTEPQSHDSGQIRELLIKMGMNQLLTNAEDRLHWAPNFKRPDLKWYTTIAHWDSPKVYTLRKGPYMIQTLRQDLAPDHPEIFLTAVYQFYDDLPYFKFYSEMQMVDDIWLELLRNDEMTMDSMFTHLAFQRPTGEIVDVAFFDKNEILENQPIENHSPWICFYNSKKGFAFGSIRIQYNNLNQFGEPSPVFQPQTQIGEWLGGIKYWNRRLIHKQLTFVPRGSRYVEENAYLVFKIGQKDRFESIKYWAERLRHPLEVKVRYQ